jgi:hypothetical protein
MESQQRAHFPGQECSRQEHQNSKSGQHPIETMRHASPSEAAAQMPHDRPATSWPSSYPPGSSFIPARVYSETMRLTTPTGMLVINVPTPSSEHPTENAHRLSGNLRTALCASNRRGWKRAALKTHLSYLSVCSILRAQPRPFGDRRIQSASYPPSRGDRPQRFRADAVSARRRDEDDQHRFSRRAGPRARNRP